MSKVVALKGNKFAKGRAQKRPTYSVKLKGRAELTTPRQDLALWAAQSFFSDERSVSVTDNAARKTVAHFIYGRRQ